MRNSVDVLVDVVLTVLMLAASLPIFLFAFNVFLGGVNFGFGIGLDDKSTVVSSTQMRQLAMGDNVEDAVFLTVCHLIMMPAVDQQLTGNRTVATVDQLGNIVWLPAPRADYVTTNQQRTDMSYYVMMGWNHFGGGPTIGSFNKADGERPRFHIYLTNNGSMRVAQRRGFGAYSPGHNIEYSAGFPFTEPEDMRIVH